MPRRQMDLQGRIATDIDGLPRPAPLKEARFYYDLDADVVKISKNGGLFETLADAGGALAFGLGSAGRGLPLGQPPGIITLAEGVAGALTGTYLYKYTETDVGGQTIGSAAATITVAAKKINVTVPLPRRGVATRNLWRTTAGGSTYFLLAEFGAGNGTYQTLYVDNIADGSLGAATIPLTDTTALFEFELAAGVKHFSTHPDQLTGPADVTFLTGDPSTGGAYGIDNYGTYFGRAARGNAMGLLVTGLDANAINCLWVGDTFDAVAAVETFRVDADGKTRITVAQPLTDAEPNALLINATMPATITQTRSGITSTIVSAGSSSQQQNAMAVSFEAGYTGNQTCNAIIATNAVATTATCVGFQGAATTGARACGVLGKATGGTTRIGGFFGLSTDPDTVVGEAGALLCSNGAIATRIFGAFDGTTLATEIRDAGAISARGVGANSFVQPLLDSLLNVGGPLGGILGRGTEGTGGASLRVTGAGNNVFFGHTNTEFLCTLGANSGSGVPFIGFCCYHGATSSTQKYASSANIPTKMQSSTGGFWSVETPSSGVAGTVGNDITWATRLKVGPNGRLFATAPATAPTDSEIGTSQITWYLDEPGNAIKIRVRYSDGTTLKLGSVALV